MGYRVTPACGTFHLRVIEVSAPLTKSDHHVRWVDGWTTPAPGNIRFTRFIGGWTAILLVELVLGFAAAPSALPQATGQAETLTLSSRNAGNAIRRAAGLLPTRLNVTIEVVDLRKLAESLRRQVGKTCAFVIDQAPPVYVLSSCPAYQEALSSLFEAMKLAAILRHELAHLEGADERHARLDRGAGSFAS